MSDPNAHRTGYKETRFGWFPEDWEERKLGDVAEVINGLTYSPDNIKEKGVLVLRSSNVQEGKIVFNDNVFVDIKVEESKKSRKNDILICVRNGSKKLIGKNALIPESCPESTHGAFMAVLRGKKRPYS